MNLGDIYIGTLQRMNKDQFGGYVSPDAFTTVIKKVNIDAVNSLINQFENDRMVSRDLLPLIKTLGDPTNVPLTFDDFGYAEIPDDYYYYARGLFNEALNTCEGVTDNIRMLEMVDQAEFAARLNTKLKAPKKSRPIMTRQNDKFIIRPIVQSVVFTYVRQPETPFFDYDIIAGVPVYLPPNAVHTNGTVLPAGTASRSVEFEYPDTMFSELIERIVREFSIGIQSQFGVQTTNPESAE
jgi:hypothetical protein